MNNERKPPPPVLPPSISVDENFCFLHKGEIQGEVYTCPTCKTRYCLDCAQNAKENAKLCVKCKRLFLI